ncbi:SCP2 sterol-binding domain-containing protein [Streptomyces sp. NPDC054961]
MPFAPLTAQLRAPDRTLRFRCTDGNGNGSGDGDWLVGLRPDGFALVADRAEPRAADATVQGTAADLLLLLYGRLDHRGDAFRLLGDPDLLSHWFTHSAF